MPIIIREANDADVPKLIDLRSILLDGGDHIYSADNEEAQMEWRKNFTFLLQRHAFIEETTRILVAEKYKKVIGCAIGIIDHRAPTFSCGNGLSGWVQSVVVSPKYQGLGIAKKLMTNLIDWFDSHKCLCIVLEATPISLSLYKNVGFRSNGEMMMTRFQEQ